jgi:hypothetical protein
VDRQERQLVILIVLVIDLIVHNGDKTIIMASKPVVLVVISFLAVALIYGSASTFNVFAKPYSLKTNSLVVRDKLC